MKRIDELETGLENDIPDAKESLRRTVEHMAKGEHKRKLENWILRNFCAAYNRDYGGKFVWVECSERPDYRVFADRDSEPQPIEATELLDPDRKRGDEYKEALREAERTGDYIPASFLPDTPADYGRKLVEQACIQLKDKFAQPYPLGTWLVIYVNLTLMPPEGEDTTTFAIRIVQTALDSLDTPERISQIWVLSNALKIARLNSG